MKGKFKKIFIKFNNLITKLKNKNVFFFVFLFIMIIVFIKKLPTYDFLNTYTLSYYVVTYSNGLLSRALIGTIFSLLGCTTKMSIVVMNLFVVFSFMLFISYILNIIVKKYNNSYILVSLLFLINTGSIINMFSYLEFGRIDIYIFILSILSLYSISKNKYYFLPVISVIGMLMHENFIVTVFPIVTMLSLYNYVKTKDKKIFKYILVNVVINLLLLVTVRYLIFKPNYESEKIFIDSLSYRTDFNINPFMISDYYYATKEGIKLSFGYIYDLQNVIDYAIAVMGYLLLFGICYLCCFSKLLYKNKNKLWLWLIILSTLSPLVLFFVACDMGRWYMNIVNGLILVTAYFLLTNYKDFKNYKLHSSACIVIILLIAFSIMFFPKKNFHSLTYKDTYKIIDAIQKTK